MTLDAFLFILEILGCLAYSLSGALAAQKKRMDFFGMAVLAGATTFGGGLIRDTLLVIKPIAIFDTPRYIVFSVMGAAIVFFFGSHVEKRSKFILILDALGLAPFTALGAMRALSAGAPWYGAILMAVITGCGGGIIRDILRGEAPLVLYGDFYASASLLGSAVMVGMLALKAPLTPSILVCCFLVWLARFIAISYTWRKEAELKKPMRQKAAERRV